MVVVSRDEDVIDALLARRVPSARTSELRIRARAGVRRLRRKELSEGRARYARIAAAAALRELGHLGLAARVEVGL
jgi:predicted metalloprotease